MLLLRSWEFPRFCARLVLLSVVPTKREAWSRLLIIKNVTPLLNMDRMIYHTISLFIHGIFISLFMIVNQQPIFVKANVLYCYSDMPTTELLGGETKYYFV